MLPAQALGEGACYSNVLNRRTVVLTLLCVSHRLFEGATVIRRLDAVAPYIFALRTGLEEKDRRALHEIVLSFDPPVLDAVRIATCFENLYKARLLLAGFVIHRIESSPRWKRLAQTQLERPVRVVEIKRAEGLVGRRDLGYAFDSLSPHTLGWRTLMKPSYQAVIKLPDRLHQCVNRVAAQRNTLHFLGGGDVGSYNEKVIVDLRYMRTAFNRYVVGGANRLLDSFHFPAGRHLPPVA
jgi:hypothetical protein